MPFQFQPFVELPDVVVVEPKSFGDDRGWFMETFKRSDFERHNMPTEFPQDNHSYSLQQGTLRGLHYQKEPAAQGKLVRCTAGSIFDVAVDIRKGSPTFGRWVSATLSAQNRKMIWVPPGFAHGVLTLSPSTEIAYKVTTEFSLEHDRGILWNDPALGIKWPLANPTLSPKDSNAPVLRQADNNFAWKAK